VGPMRLVAEETQPEIALAYAKNPQGPSRAGTDPLGAALLDNGHVSDP
jgi:hypothetical protein